MYIIRKAARNLHLAINKMLVRLGVRLIPVNKKVRAPNLDKKYFENLEVLEDRTALVPQFKAGGKGCEIGVYEGKFSQQLISLSQPELLLLIDAWDSQRYGPEKRRLVERKFSTEINRGKIEIRQGYSTTELKALPDNYLDWAYIDTSHTYEQTLKELNLCKKKVKKRGIIAGHDYCQGNIRKGTQYGVIRAVHSFCRNQDYEIKYLTLETHGHRSFALKKL